ncbi:hypothetical protein ACN6KF_005687 [Labrys sp. La1]|uniref:hypothetical protein n=1 Tax=Labrys sp. La1 TaxID=3404917 RepID=UPI003EC05284
MINRNGKRISLLPGVNKTCIAVSADSNSGPGSIAQMPSAPAPVPDTIVPHAAPVMPPSSEILPTATQQK